MNIQNIPAGIINAATRAYHTTGTFVVWFSHKVESAFFNRLVPLIQNLWNATLSAIKALPHLFKSGPSIPFAIAGGLFLTGIAAFKMADHHAYEDDRVSKAAWKTLGIAAFVSATVVTSVGIAALVV
jgi:hypothetical protein